MSPPTRRIPAALRQRVAEAARFRCGYCLASQRIIGPLLEIDHIRLIDVLKFALFGSVLRDDFRPDSDVDVLVEFEAGHVQ
jgi:predicted nucleotidyltransferase